MNPIIAEFFSDNGGHSHWSVIDADTGETIIQDIEEVKAKKNQNKFDEICDNCGYRLGYHNSGLHKWPSNYCPGSEGGKNWKKPPGTFFKPTGKYKEEK